MNLSRLSLAAFVLLAACHDDAPAKSTNDTASMPASATPPPPAEPMTATPAPTAMPSATMADTKPAAPTLSDGDIAAVETAANKGEIDMAQLANKTSKNAQVKSFAAMMIKEHGDAQAKADKIVKSASITPTENDVSKKVKSDGDATMTTLKSAKGADFDKAYMDAQVKAHTDVLSAIDDKLLPNVKNADLKAHLTDMRGHVQMHLDKAKDISGKLGAKP